MGVNHGVLGGPVHRKLLLDEIERWRKQGFKLIALSNMSFPRINAKPDAILESDKNIVIVEVNVTQGHRYTKDAITYLSKLFRKSVKVIHLQPLGTQIPPSHIITHAQGIYESMKIPATGYYGNWVKRYEDGNIRTW